MEEDIKILEKKLKQWRPYKKTKWAIGSIEEEPEIDIQGIDKIRIELDNNGIASKIINQLVKAVKQLDNQINNK